jgi:hypothetical protein
MAAFRKAFAASFVGIGRPCRIHGPLVARGLPASRLKCLSSQPIAHTGAHVCDLRREAM